MPVQLLPGWRLAQGRFSQKGALLQHVAAIEPTQEGCGTQSHPACFPPRELSSFASPGLLHMEPAPEARMQSPCVSGPGGVAGMFWHGGRGVTGARRCTGRTAAQARASHQHCSRPSVPCPAPPACLFH
uniref:Uncharacterized protein n=1 Tax=Varanus komodoensis TaxID=61221 RepID=A0A8D2L6B5_VARKO